MSRFLRRRATALIAEADSCRAQGANEEALKRLRTACDLLHRCGSSSGEPPVLLRLIGALSANLGDEELSDKSLLEARRREFARKR